jgi:hypothetical protein
MWGGDCAGAPWEEPGLRHRGLAAWMNSARGGSHAARVGCVCDLDPSNLPWGQGVLMGLLQRSHSLLRDSAWVVSLGVPRHGKGAPSCKDK